MPWRGTTDVPGRGFMTLFSGGATTATTARTPLVGSAATTEWTGNIRGGRPDGLRAVSATSFRETGAGPQGTTSPPGGSSPDHVGSLVSQE
jgi:hypothetical protein